MFKTSAIPDQQQESIELRAIICSNKRRQNVGGSVRASQGGPARLNHLAIASMWRNPDSGYAVKLELAVYSLIRQYEEKLKLHGRLTQKHPTVVSWQHGNFQRLLVWKKNFHAVRFIFANNQEMRWGKQIIFSTCSKHFKAERAV